MKRGDIYFYKLKDYGGNVQGGCRPVIVVQNDMGNSYSDTTIVCALTSQTKANLPTHVEIKANYGLEKDSTILCEQMFTVNKSQLVALIGTIEDRETLNKLDNALKVSLDL